MKLINSKSILLLALLLSASFVLKSHAYNDSYSDDPRSKIVENKYDYEAESSYDSTFDFDGFRNKNNSSEIKYLDKKPKALFASSREDIALNDLVFRIFMLAFISVGFLVLIKLFLLKKAPEQEFNFSGMDFLNNPLDISGKPNPQMGNLLGAQGLTLKQSLNLTASQSVNLVEIDGKKLLIGCTQQGGVQLLADLTEVAKPLGEKDPESENLLELLKKLVKNDEKDGFIVEKKDESPFSESISESPFIKSSASSSISPSEVSQDMNQEIIVKDVKNTGSDVYSFQDAAYSRRPFRRRPTYRESISVYTVR